MTGGKWVANPLPNYICLYVAVTMYMDILHFVGVSVSHWHGLDGKRCFNVFPIILHIHEYSGFE